MICDSVGSQAEEMRAPETDVGVGKGYTGNLAKHVPLVKSHSPSNCVSDTT